MIKIRGKQFTAEEVTTAQHILLENFDRKGYAYIKHPVNKCVIEAMLEFCADFLVKSETRMLDNTIEGRIVNTVADVFKTTVESMRSRRRDHDVCAFPRFVAYKLLYDNTALNFKQIGRMFGERAHCSVYYGYQEVNRSIEAYETLSFPSPVRDGYIKALNLLIAEGILNKSDYENTGKKASISNSLKDNEEKLCDAIPEPDRMYAETGS